MSERRFLVPPGDVDPSGEGAWVTGAEHHHLSRVLRLHPGDDVGIFDGAGGGHHGVVESIERDRTRLRLTGPDDRPVEPGFRLTLAQGIPHSDRMEWLIQKATELGVSRVVPLVCDHGVVRPSGEGWGRLARWRRVAQDAARQCGRRRVPEVTEPIPSQDLMRPDQASDVPQFLLTEPAAGETGGAPRLAPGSQGALVAVGPEGGWSAQELERARAAAFAPISFGPRVLRSETAGIVAVALLMHLAGDLGPRGR